MTAIFDQPRETRRILSIDGGGMRGALAVGILAELERTLREKLGKPDLLLCDYFDLIGGTSTGAIIAAGLALGKDAEYLRELYHRLGPMVFRKHMPRIWGVQSRFDP
ncbi:MAG TPA: patatin-like phospholipase family protein, partial [Caulobacteraceae bacterium]|nr:patatin-like phospholipase family protein [Caulobacteraceae bacterium]